MPRSPLGLPPERISIAFATATELAHQLTATQDEKQQLKLAEQIIGGEAAHR
jgi:hypothetical protein